MLVKLKYEKIIQSLVEDPETKSKTLKKIVEVTNKANVIDSDQKDPASKNQTML